MSVFAKLKEGEVVLVEDGTCVLTNRNGELICFGETKISGRKMEDGSVALDTCPAGCVEVQNETDASRPLRSV